MIKNILLTSFLFCSIGCATAGELALNTAAGALGNMLDRRVEDKLGNDAGLSDEKLDNLSNDEKAKELKKKFKELETRLMNNEEMLIEIYDWLIDELEKRLDEKERKYGCPDCKDGKWGRTNW